MLRTVVARGELLDHIEHRVTEAADVEDVLAVRRLGGGPGLHIDAHQPRLRVDGLDPLPLTQGFSRPMAPRIDPRLVVRDQDQGVHLALGVGQLCQGRRAVGPATADGRQFLRIAHHTVPRVEADIHHPDLERHDPRRRLLAQHRCRHQRRHIDAPHRRSGALAITGDRAVHRPRDIRAHHHRALQRRHVGQRQFQGILQRLANLLRHFVPGHAVGRQQLVRVDPGLGHFGGIRQPRRHILGATRHLERAMAGQGVEVHAQPLPAHIVRLFGPLLAAQGFVAEQLERHLRHRRGRPAAKRQQGAGQLGQRLRIHRLADQPGEEGCAPGLAWLGVNHLDHVRQRRLVTHRGLQQLAFAGAVQPVLHQALGLRPQGSAPGRPAAQDLHEVAQHLAVVHHLGKQLRHQGRALRGQRRQQQGRHVFHMTLLPSVTRGLGNETAVDFAHQLQHRVQLTFRRGVEGRVQATGHRQLGQAVLGVVGIGRSLGSVQGVARWSFCLLGVEQLEVGHLGVSLCCLVRCQRDCSRCASFIFSCELFFNLLIYNDFIFKYFFLCESSRQSCR
ncbi:hypothetical protein EMIT0373P_20203 [Pseudomonas chlororaphis]